VGRSRYIRGDYNVIDDRTGRKVKRSECRLEWNGALVHKDEWEARHPQDFVRGIPDDQSVPLPRTEGTTSFLDSTSGVQKFDYGSVDDFAFDMEDYGFVTDAATEFDDFGSV
jgi:hypothetical protein